MMVPLKATAPAAGGNHFSCSLTAVLLAVVHAHGGPAAVTELIELAGSSRSREYLSDIAQWVSYDEAIALWRAGARITHHPQFARAVGEASARQLNGSPVAALLRSLGSPENVYRQIALTSSKYSVVSTLEAIEVRPGYAEISAVPLAGFERDVDHCAWTTGLLTQPTVLFGLPPATVEHAACAAMGAPDCRYRVSWSTDSITEETIESGQSRVLREQLDAMQERLRSMFATASDLIGADRIEDVLARITDRAAVEIRAPRYLLTIRLPNGDVVSHHRGFTEEEASAHAVQLLGTHPAALPESWLTVPVRSSRRDYGRLLTRSEAGHRFFPEERDLFEVYARYAATALDSATALMEAEQRHDQSSALLELARSLAAASTSDEVAQRLADAVPLVVDCDRVGVYLWDEGRNEIVRSARSASSNVLLDEPAHWSLAPSPGGLIETLQSKPNSEPIFVSPETGDLVLRELSANLGAVASILVPLSVSDRFLGVLSVSVMTSPDRLRPSPELLDRLSGVVAQASTALQNGRLVDQITHQALHDELTGLANRARFRDTLHAAVHQAHREHGEVTIFYVDLDNFKPVNDEFGHDAGDQLLAAVAARLAACTRASDTVARLGGDEFVVLVDPESPRVDGGKIAGRLAAAFMQPFSVAGHQLMVHASIGSAVFPADADSAARLMGAADADMYVAKAARTQARPRTPSPS